MEEKTRDISQQHSRIELFYEVAGWYGMLALITAYGLTSFGVISGVGVVFQVLNLTGAMGLILISYHKQVWQNVSLNIF